jgi:hypothetical protein
MKGELDDEDTDDGKLDSGEPRDDEYSSNEFQQPDAQHKVFGQRGPIGKTNTVGWLRSEASAVTNETSTLDIEGDSELGVTCLLGVAGRYFWLIQ